MYKIGELSKLCSLPVKTLRYYDSEGILCPDYTDSFTGYRYYSANKLFDCHRIIALKELGFTLDEIKEQFSLTSLELRKLIAVKLNELSEQELETKRRIKVLKEIDSSLKEDKSLFSIVVKKSEAFYTVYTRKILNSRFEAHNIISEMRSSLPQNILGERSVIIDYETEFNQNSFDTGICVELKGAVPQNCGYEKKQIVFCDETASLICTPEQYDEALIELYKHIHDNMLQVVGAVYRIIYGDKTVEIKIPVCRMHEEFIQRDETEEFETVFEDDESVIGHWEVVDFLPSREHFNPEKKKSMLTDNSVREYYFLPGGEWYWCFGWTKGFLLSNSFYPQRRCKNRYTTERINGEHYLFAEMKYPQYFKGGKTELLVLKQLDCKRYTKDEIAVKDIIPDAPADDDKILGKWEVCDFIKNPDNFSLDVLNKVYPKEALYWLSAEFLPGGGLISRFNDGRTDGSPVCRWVTGNVICTPKETVSMYRYREYNGIKYLFIQWKSGDYIFGKMEPHWYVFTRGEE